MNEEFEIVVRLFVEVNQERLREIENSLKSKFNVEIKSKDYYKFEGWHEVWFYLKYSEDQNNALYEVSKMLGGNWEIVYGDNDEDYSGYAIWTTEMGGEMIFPEVRFGNLLVNLL